MEWIKRLAVCLTMAQTAAYALDLSGKIVDDSQQPVPNALVVLASTGQNTTSGVDGKFSMTNIAAITAPIGKSANSDLTVRSQGNAVFLNASSVDVPVSIMFYSLSGRIAFSHTVLREGSNTVDLPDRIAQGHTSCESSPQPAIIKGFFGESAI